MREKIWSFRDVNLSNPENRLRKLSAQDTHKVEDT